MDQHQETLLINVVRDDDLNAAEYLLTENSDVNHLFQLQFHSNGMLTACTYGNVKMVQFLTAHSECNETPTFSRHWNKMRGTNQHVTELQEKVDAYIYLRSIFPGQQLEAIMLAWSTAINTFEEAGISLKRDVKQVPSCKHCRMTNTEDNDRYTKSLVPINAWDAVRVEAQEIVTGIEFLQRAARPDGPTRFLISLPYFHCPTSTLGRCNHSLVYDSVFRINRYPVFNKAYHAKFEHIMIELQSLYRVKEISLLYHINNSTEQLHQTLPRSNTLNSKLTGSNKYLEGYMIYNHCNSRFKNLVTNVKITGSTCIAEAILGIEWTCFVQTRYHQNDEDASSYYLQRQWLIHNYHCPPRTNYRCFYRICQVCGHMIIRIGGLHCSQSKRPSLPLIVSTEDYTCKRCSLDLLGINNQSFEVSKQSIDDYQRYRISDCRPRTKTTGKVVQTANYHNLATNVCSHCGLVSEQHPLLQSLRKSCKNCFGRVHENTSEEDKEWLRKHPDVLQLKKLLIILLLDPVSAPFETKYLFIEEFIPTDLHQFANVCLRYALNFLKLFSSCSYINCLIAIDHLITFVSHTLTEKPNFCIDKKLIQDYLELTIDCFENLFMKKKEICNESEQYNERDFYYIIMSLTENALQLISLVLVTIFRHCRFKHLLSKRLIVMNSGRNSSNANNFRQGNLSTSLIRSFIGLVYRLVCLDPRSYTDQNLLYFACSNVTSIFPSTYIGRLGQTLTITLLLQLGADPNCADMNGQTVVGYVLENSLHDRQLSHHLLAVLKKGGAHLDAYHPLNVQNDRKGPINDFLREYSISHTSNERLTCLAATTMKRNGLTSNRLKIIANLPENLLTFLDLH